MQTIHVCVSVPAIIICVWIFFLFGFSSIIYAQLERRRKNHTLVYTPLLDQYYDCTCAVHITNYIRLTSRLLYRYRVRRLVFVYFIYRRAHTDDIQIDCDEMYIKKKFKRRQRRSFYRCRHGPLKSAASGLQ